MENYLHIWLLKGDPSIRFQTHRDLLFSSPKIILQEQKKIHISGWGASLLSHQDSNGMFGGGLYGPKWISTTYTCIQLAQIGLIQKHPLALKSCQLLLSKGFYKDGGINFFPSLKCSEICVTAMILYLCSYFNLEDERLDSLAYHLLQKQLIDGGWNCNYFKGEFHSSFHTTISVLEALNQFRGFKNIFKNQIEKSIEGGTEFLLQHKLFRSHRTNKIVDNRMLRFSFPTRWKYDIMRCLDYFQLIKIKKDCRMIDAIEVLIKKRNKDGTWNLQNRHAGKTYFEMETVGRPSRWNTLRALRILKWWK